MQGFFDEFRQPIFHANPWPQLIGKHGALLGHMLDRPANFRHCAELFARAGLRTHTHKSRAQQALQVRLGFAGQSFSHFADGMSDRIRTV